MESAKNSTWSVIDALQMFDNMFESVTQMKSEPD